MAVDLTILVGTMTGTAQLVAQELELSLDGDEANIKTVLLDGKDASVFAGGGLFLLCTSTYGQGDVPDNARQLWDSLQSSRPELGNVHYGLIALGDRTYAETFCFGGKKFDALLAELGAKRIGEPLIHDASSGTLPEEIALEWVKPWLELARAELKLPA